MGTTATFAAACLKSGLHGFFLLLIELTVLVGVELLHELGVMLGAVCFAGSLYGFLLLVIDLTVLVGVELLHELGAVLGTACIAGGLHGLLLLLIELTVLVGVKLLQALDLASLKARVIHAARAVAGRSLSGGGGGSRLLSHERHSRDK